MHFSICEGLDILPCGFDIRKKRDIEIDSHAANKVIVLKLMLSIILGNIDYKIEGSAAHQSEDIGFSIFKRPVERLYFDAIFFQELCGTMRSVEATTHADELLRALHKIELILKWASG